jgi:hypothetical protein
MSGKVLVIVGVVILVLALIIGGVILFTRLEPQQAMANGPGVIYFFSPT